MRSDCARHKSLSRESSNPRPPTPFHEENLSMGGHTPFPLVSARTSLCTKMGRGEGYGDCHRFRILSLLRGCSSQLLADCQVCGVSSRFFSVSCIL